MKKENLLLLHGALGSKAQLKPLKQILEPRFNVFDLNFEGHGDVYSDQDFSIDLFASNVQGFLEKQNLGNTHIFGYSMGGYVALHLANHKSSLVNKIVTLGTKFDWNPEGAAREIKMLNPDKVEEKIPAFAGYLNKLHSALSWKVVMQKTAHMMEAMGNGKRLSSKDLGSISNETLIGIGSLDNMVTLNESKEAANALPNGKLTVIQDFQHPIAKVDMKVLSEFITAFIEA